MNSYFDVLEKSQNLFKKGFSSPSEPKGNSSLVDDNSTGPKIQIEKLPDSALLKIKPGKQPLVDFLKLDNLNNNLIQNTNGPAGSNFSAMKIIRSQPAENLRDDLFYEGYITERKNVLDIYYLEKGIRSAKSVCRVNVKDTDRYLVEAGTGFIIKGGYLVTNYHVLIINGENHTEFSNIEFNVQMDVNGDSLSIVRYNLVPDQCIFSEELDLAIVKVAEMDTENKIPLTEFGSISLSGRKNINEEEDSYLSIIQHPGGGYKKIALRENYTIRFEEVKEYLKAPDNVKHLIWYATNTSTGSSGAPVFDDRWRLVAVHHSGIPVQKDGKYLCVDNISRTKEELVQIKGFRDLMKYKANEGIKAEYLINILQTNNIYQE